MNYKDELPLDGGRTSNRWGVAPLPLYWESAMMNGGSTPELSPANPRYKAAIVTGLPLPITRLLGPHIVRSIP